MKEIRKDASEMEGVAVSVEHVQANRCALVVSTLLVGQEVKDGRMSPEMQKEYERTLQRPNVSIIDMEPPIMALSRELFDFYVAARGAGTSAKTLHIADAIHLATAINRRVNAFYTFDAGKKGGSLSLLSLNGNVAGYKLEITKPPVEQGVLPFWYS
jgi:hypothetical protein